MNAGTMRDRLQLALQQAMKERDSVAISALRSALAAIANAEAVPATSGEGVGGNEFVAGSAGGLGAAERERRMLTEAESEAIVQREVADRLTAAGEYEQAGHQEPAQRLRQEAAALATAVR